MATSSSNSADQAAQIRTQRRWLEKLVCITIVLLLSSLVLTLATSGAFGWITNAVAFPCGIAIGTVAIRLNAAKRET